MKPLSLLCPSPSGGWGDPLLRPGQSSSGTDLGVEANIICATALKSESCFLQISTNQPHCPLSFSNFKDESEKTKMDQKPRRTTALLLKWCFLLVFLPSWHRLWGMSLQYPYPSHFSADVVRVSCSTNQIIMMEHSPTELLFPFFILPSSKP